MTLVNYYKSVKTASYTASDILGGRQHILSKVKPGHKDEAYKSLLGRSIVGGVLGAIPSAAAGGFAGKHIANRILKGLKYEGKAAPIIRKSSAGIAAGLGILPGAFIGKHLGIRSAKKHLAEKKLLQEN